MKTIQNVLELLWAGCLDVTQSNDFKDENQYIKARDAWLSKSLTDIESLLEKNAEVMFRVTVENNEEQVKAIALERLRKVSDDKE